MLGNLGDGVSYSAVGLASSVRIPLCLLLAVSDGVCKITKVAVSGSAMVAWAALYPCKQLGGFVFIQLSSAISMQATGQRM